MTIGPPVCKVCGHAHWLRDPHIFGKTKAKKADPKSFAKKTRGKR